MIVLQTLGIIFIVVLLVLAWYGWKYLQTGKLGKDGLADDGFMAAYALIPDMEVDIEPSDITNWSDQNRLVELENELRKLKLQHCGYYVWHSSGTSSQISIWSFNRLVVFTVHEEKSSTSDTEEARFWLESICQLNNRATISVRNDPLENALPRPAHQTLINIEADSPRRLIEHLKANIPKGTKPIEIDAPHQFLQEMMENQYEWLWQDKQLRSEQMLKRFKSAGIEANDELIQSLLEHAAISRSALRTKQILRLVAKSPKINAAKWNEMRDNLNVIHEQMDMDSFIATIYEMCIGLSEAQEKMLDSLAHHHEHDSTYKFNPILELEKLKKSLAPVLKIKRIVRLTQPVSAEVYLRSFK